MKCKACDVGTVNYNPEHKEFDILCSACRNKAAKAYAMDQYDLEGYWNDDDWEQHGGKPFTRVREWPKADNNYMSSGNRRSPARGDSENA